MVSSENFRTFALSLASSEEVPHFEKPSFRFGKKIFATLDLGNKRGCLKLTPEDQSVYAAFDPENIYPVPNKWGKQGWTFFELNAVRKDLMKDALSVAYETVRSGSTRS